MIADNIGMDVLDVEDVLNEFGKIALEALSNKTGVSISCVGTIAPNTSVATPKNRRAGSFRFKPARELRLRINSPEKDISSGD